MIYLELFLTFLKIGAVSFGGGYGMISLIREEVLLHAWLNETDFMNMIAISESTPGPLAVNMATFIGSVQGGFVGAMLATVGVVLPSFCIILLVAMVFLNVAKYKGVQAILSGIRPVVIGLILATAITLLGSTVFSFSKLGDDVEVDVPALIIFALICIIVPLYKKVFQKKLSPIAIIMMSAVLGMFLYAV